MLTNGKTAGQLADERETPVVLFDLCADYAHASAIAISCAAQNDAQHNAKAIRLLQSLGKQVIPLPDYPGLLTMRTGHAGQRSARRGEQRRRQRRRYRSGDAARRQLSARPAGPGAALGWRHILATLENLQRYYGEARYRPMPLLRRYASPPLSQSRTMNANTPRALAQRCAEQMFQQDTCAQAMGMHIDAVDAGYAQVSMTVGPQMLNGHQTCHSGQLFSLADTASPTPATAGVGGGGLRLQHRLRPPGAGRRSPHRQRGDAPSGQSHRAV